MTRTARGGGGNRPGEDGPYRPPNPADAPKYPPDKVAKKNKKTKSLTEKSDIPYGQPEKATNDVNDNKRTYFT